MRRPRRLALTVAALGIALGAGGCGYFNPVQTHEFYQAADGTNQNIENSNGTLAVGARNMIVIVHEDGSAELVGAVANYTNEEVSVELSGQDESSTVFTATVKVPAQSTVALVQKHEEAKEGDQTVEVKGLSAKPGSMIRMSITALGESREFTLPITDTTLEYYKPEGGAQK